MASHYEPRIRKLAAEARATRERVLEDGPSKARALEAVGTGSESREDCATAAARDGLGPVVGLYIEARTAEEGVRFSARELELLHRATNDWLAVYAACFGVEFDPDFTVREAAQLVVDTHDVSETAALLTQVPERSSRT